jgi:hypothetical protein
MGVSGYLGKSHWEQLPITEEAEIIKMTTEDNTIESLE